jgi:hypothetical protein
MIPFFSSKKESDPVKKPCDRCDLIVEFFTDGQCGPKFFCHACLALRPYVIDGKFAWEESEVFLRLDLEIEEFLEDFYLGGFAA